MAIRDLLKSTTRRFGVEVAQYRFSVTKRRQQIFDHYGVQLLIDVGANEGQYAQAARRSGFRGRILSFEPASEPYRVLAAAAAADELWDHRQCAVGAASGAVRLNLSDNSYFNSILSITQDGLDVQPDARSRESEEVVLESLDSELSGYGYGVGENTALKVDVQGFERDVLDGAAQLLEHVSVVEIELSPRPVYDSQMLMAEAIERMDSAGLVLSLTENLLMDSVSGRSLQFNGLFVRA